MRRFGIEPNRRKKSKVLFVRVVSSDPYDARQGIQIGDTFPVVEQLEGCYKVQVPFRDFPYPIISRHVEPFQVMKKSA